MALKRIIPGGFVANRCSPARWFTSPSLIALGFIQSSQGSAPAVPSAPTGLALSIITAAVRLDWNAVPTATSYNIYRSLAGGGGTLYQSGVTDIFFEDSSVTSGQSYFYEVTAVNGVGESARSAEEEIIPQLPADPTGLATTSITGTTVDLGWDADAGVTWEWQVQLAGGDWSSPLNGSPTATNSATISGLSPSTSYDFRIQAQNAFGFSGWVELLGVQTSQVTPEVSRVVAAADVGGSKHGKYFYLYDVNGSVSITLDGGARAQELQFDFVGLNGAAFNTNAEGKYVLIDGGQGGLDCYWFNTGTESVPSGLTAANYYEVLVGAYDFAPAIAAALLGSATGYGFTDNGSSGDLCRLRNTAAGVTVNPDAGNAGAALTLEASGRDAAASPGTADRNIFITISDGLPAADIASSIKSTLDSDGAWFCILSGSTVDAYDMVAGARTDAADVNTGFTISTIQQGGTSALTLDNDTLDLVFAWSLSRRVRTLYAGNLVRLRDSTTTTEGNVGYDGGNLFDTTARDALIGAHDATLKTIYDQSPNAFDTSQATPSKQPPIKTGGTIQTINGNQAATFVPGNANVLQTASVSHGIGTADFCISAIIKTGSSLASWESLLGFGAYGYPGVYLNRGTTAGFWWGADYLFATTFATNTVYVVTFIRQSGVYKLYVNGTLDANTPAILFDNVADGVINLMSDSGSADYGNSTLLECIMWKRIPTNLAAIIADQRAHAGV